MTLTSKNVLHHHDYRRRCRLGFSCDVRHYESGRGHQRFFILWTLFVCLSGVLSCSGPRELDDERSKHFSGQAWSWYLGREITTLQRSGLGVERVCDIVDENSQHMCTHLTGDLAEGKSQYIGAPLGSNLVEERSQHFGAHLVSGVAEE